MVVLPALVERVAGCRSSVAEPKPARAPALLVSGDVMLPSLEVSDADSE